MFRLFKCPDTVRITVDTDDSAVISAVNDLQRNIEAIADGELSNTAVGVSFVVGISNGGSFEGLTVPDGEEQYIISVADDRVIIAGSDALGTVYGIYEFSHRFLKIDPLYRFSGIMPEKVKQLEIENTVTVSEKSAVRFRGWFINDEDLLTEFRGGGGVRHIDYRYYSTVMADDVLDTVLETALRCGMNLIIPASFADIDNPDEERLIRRSVERGLYVSQHHVEPMGVSYFAAETYMKKHGIEGDVSFISNKDAMLEIWRYYARKWAKYGKNVIWQLGLRGKGDRAVWQNDSAVGSTDEARGKIITDAIDAQYGIIAETVGNSFLSSSTLWLECAGLYRKGHLKLPSETVVVFSDIGISQMFGDDIFTVPHKPGSRYGVYYHAAFWNRGPHLAEGCSPEKMVYNYKIAAEKDCLYYSILNVSNIREVQLAVRVNSALLKDVEHFSADGFLKRHYSEVFGEDGETAYTLRSNYYRCCADMGYEYLKKLCNQSFDYHEYKNLPFYNFAADNSQLRMLGMLALRNKPIPENVLPELEKSRSAFLKHREALISFGNRVGERCADYYAFSFLRETECMLRLTEWSIAVIKATRFVSDGDGASAKDAFTDGINALNKLQSALKNAETGDFVGWYNGEKKMNIRELCEITEQKAAEL